MLHLFNKVFVDFNRPSNNIDSILIAGDYYELLEYAKEHVTRTKQQLVLHADKETFLKFVSYWFKGLFQNPTAESTFAIIKCHLLKINQLPSSSRSVIPEPVFEISEKEFVDIYNTVTVDADFLPFIKQVIKGVSFEFLFASYLYNGSYKQELKKEIHKLVKRDVQGFIIETRESILENSTKAKLHRIFNIQPYTYLNAEQIMFDPDMSWFFNVFKDGQVAWDIFDNEQVRETFIEKTSDYLKQWECTDDSSPCLRRLKFIPIVKGDELTDAGLQQIIDFEVGTPSCSSFSAMNRQNFNVYFIDYILGHLCTDKNLEFLKHFTVKA